MGVGPYFAVTGSQCDGVSLGEFLDFSKDLLEASGPNAHQMTQRCIAEDFNLSQRMAGAVRVL